MYINLMCLLTPCGINVIYFIPRMNKINLHNCTVLWLYIDVSLHIFFCLCYVMPLSDVCVCVWGGGRRHQYESLDSLIMPDSYVWYVWLAISLLQIVG